MSFVGKTKYNKNKKTIKDNGGMLELINNLEKKIVQLKPQNVSNLENKIIKLENTIKNLQPQNLEKKISDLEKKIKDLPKNNNDNDNKILNNIINDDLNKIKIKIEKNEKILKKMLFN